MAQLAIKGHLTRGKEVIEILKMLGAKEEDIYKGNDTNWVYIINEGYVDWDYPSDKYTIYTLEELLEKYPYKVGDKVRLDKWPCTILSMEWDYAKNGVLYTIKGIDFSKCVYVEDLQPYEETMEERQYKELRMPLDDDDKLATEATIDGNKILPPNGYLIGKITQLDNGMFVEYVKKQSQYPKTYEECIEVLNFGDYTVDIWNVTAEEYKLFTVFIKLIRCRDAYWKIAGDWKPDYHNPKKETFYFLFNSGEYIDYGQAQYPTNKVLIFPTDEMRDAFYENFKDLIEQCKELL